VSLATKVAVTKPSVRMSREGNSISTTRCALALPVWSELSSVRVAE